MLSLEGDFETAIKVLPISVIEQDKLIEFLSGERNYLDDLSLRESYRYVKSVSYGDFLSDRVGLDDETSSIFYALMKLLWGVGGKNISVMDMAIEYLPWMIVSPIVSVWSFLYDGVFTGATRSRDMRNAMLVSLLMIFLPSWYLLQPLGNHGLCNPHF